MNELQPESTTELVEYAPVIPRVTPLVTLPSGEIRLEMGADGLYLLFDADCLDCLPYCKAQCCSLHGITITEEEWEDFNGRIPTEPNERLQSYEMRRDADGFCACLHRETRRCGIYEERPQTCRTYHCTRGAYQRGWKLPNSVQRLRDA